MNPYSKAIETCLDILQKRKFTKPLPATQGSILYEYVNQRVPVEVPIHISDQLFMDVISRYKIKNKDYPTLIEGDLMNNKTILNQHKSELIRCFLFNRQHVITQLF